jgi:hypothetical protein
MSARILKTIVSALLVGLALSACGSSTTTSSSASASATKTVTQTASPTTSASTGSASSTAASSSTAAAGSVCRTPNLKLSFVSGQGAAGTAYMTYALTNTGPSSCTMTGFPGVAMLDAGGNVVQHPAQRGVPTPTPVRLVSLLSGQRATFIVTSSDVIPSPGCQHAWTGVTLQVYPPNQRSALLLPHHAQFCNLHVGAVTRG